jgi:hypothetical protein
LAAAIRGDNLAGADVANAKAHLYQVRRKAANAAAERLRAEQAAADAAADAARPGPRWLLDDPSWTGDDAEHRSNAVSEEDGELSGRATNLLREAGSWNAGDAEAAQWVIFDLQKEYELTKFEIQHAIDVPEACAASLALDLDGPACAALESRGESPHPLWFARRPETASCRSPRKEDHGARWPSGRGR